MRFSVIVPIYNAEAYLRECVDSILAQTHPEFELILVDDGAKDSCPQICDDYARQDARVRVIHQENGGLVRARQTGVQAAQGDYVVFVDADDWVEKTLLETANRLVDAHAPDLISFGYTKMMPGLQERMIEPVPEGLYDRPAIEAHILPRVLMGEDMKNMFSYVWSKAVRRDILLKRQMQVNPAIRLGEDAACTVGLYCDASRVYICPDPMFFYRLHSQSMSHDFKFKQYDELETVVRHFEQMNAPIEGFEQQIHRYVFLVLFCLLLGTVFAGAKDRLEGIEKAMDRDIFRKHLSRSEFSGITPKTRIAHFFLKRGRIRETYHFLALCRMIKKG